MSDRFVGLLRRHRIRRRLTQEALAERAGISTRSVGAIERGAGRAPRPQTIEQLATALALTGDERADFVSAGHALFWASRRDEGSARDVLAEVPPRPAPAQGDMPPRQLPADLPDFVGRADEVAELCSALSCLDTGAVRLASVSGPPGVGKTALAVHAAHRLAPHFPDGQLYASLRGTSDDPGEVLGQLLYTLGYVGTGLPTGLDARAALFRASLAGRRVLLVLDDAAGHRQIEPLIPSDGSAVLLTSRLPLTGIPGITTIDLGPLDAATAVELMSRVVGAQRIHAHLAAARQLVAICGGLPLAVRIAAARLAARPCWTVETFTDRLADKRRRLDELRHGDLALRPGLELAYGALSPVARRAFALLGALEVPSFPEWFPAALLGTTPARGAAALDELIDARLLETLGPDPAGRPRFRLHDVTRLFARERREAEIDQGEWADGLSRLGLTFLALDRLACHRRAGGLLGGAELASRVTPAPPPSAAAAPIDWYEAERETVAVLARTCLAAGLTALARELASSRAKAHEGMLSAG
ncbi:XRE family transcriptional regulator [Micromonospora sp. A3M-1-15]|uniref:helix-turn-helix domain-containing protein n=1 Tax=Micromonospora sp. A3M-1-15 TaxID=2962035 RepID=UPI0020B74EDC|nr:helix-turn-helix domain-containing protein [Micromonospora sp. A3M-1-15]MCP3784059.1 XRE family transcriptional regulator [Micromonospora sp. A3M-1-15]